MEAGAGVGVAGEAGEAVEAEGSVAGAVSTGFSSVAVGSSVSAAACVESPISEFIEFGGERGLKMHFVLDFDVVWAK